MDLGGGHLAIIVGTGDGAIASKNFPQGRAFDKCFQVLGICPGDARGWNWLVDYITISIMLFLF